MIEEEVRSVARLATISKAGYLATLSATNIDSNPNQNQNYDSKKKKKTKTMRKKKRKAFETFKISLGATNKHSARIKLALTGLSAIYLATCLTFSNVVKTTGLSSSSDLSSSSFVATLPTQQEIEGKFIVSLLINKVICTRLSLLMRYLHLVSASCKYDAGKIAVEQKLALFLVEIITFKDLRLRLRLRLRLSLRLRFRDETVVVVA